MDKGLRKVACGVVIAFLLGLLILWPAEYIIEFINKVSGIGVSYLDIQIIYIVLLILISKFIFKKLEK
ncbi:hypothetical protein D5R81_18880 [Parashewanella spongiae]|uniref:Uncharacterized protein n=1 Tax=Parashewanella spongiae TaxID=342950 RepID=A0A3A6TTY3_9GAMM|nr:hypothetical protein [Parashewanella spongiae]MCL1080084.1 hypothetical protein [Parashewanella spongiae]RJY04943.1 hypothetical protein D5R81_18880 [Parashewanella spongiae]